MSGPLLAVDAPSVLFRAFYALPKTIVGKDEEPVNALLGSINIVLQEVLRHRPRAVVMCFGDDAAAYRLELYPAYHADRTEPLPPEFAGQYTGSPALFEALGWTVADRRGLEADDLLGSYVLAEQEAGGEALILTGDRDMFQCVTERCKVLYLKTGARGAEVVDVKEVERRYGVPPELVPDFIALRGDPSDGIPGAPGVGEKTAAALLKRQGSLEKVIAGALRESPRLRGALRDNADELRAFKEIATLRRLDVDLPPDRETDFAAGEETVRALGMNRLAERFAGLAKNKVTE
jgi:DNA polymerase-1